MDIFFTHSYQYVLEEDAGSVGARLAKMFSRADAHGTLLAENSFRLGHPGGMRSFRLLDAQPAYLSGSYDALAPRAIPSRRPGRSPEFPVESEPEYQHRTLVDIRIRPHLLLVIIAYVVSLLLLLDLLGIELFWKNNYLIRLSLLCTVAVVDIWLIFRVVASMKKRFEVTIVRLPDDISGNTGGE